jgi:hypothetical protein
LSGGGGEFDGVITVLDASTCDVVAQVPARGGLIAVVIAEDGVVQVMGAREAFPDASSLPAGQLTMTDDCS